jgi:hypothetical protein
MVQWCDLHAPSQRLRPNVSTHEAFLFIDCRSFAFIRANVPFALWEHASQATGWWAADMDNRVGDPSTGRRCLHDAAGLHHLEPLAASRPRLVRCLRAGAFLHTIPLIQQQNAVHAVPGSSSLGLYTRRPGSC